MRSPHAMVMGAAFVSCVLTACGGGGGGGENNHAPDATPSTALSSPTNTSTSPSHFSAVWRVHGSSSATDRALTIIDTDTQRVVRTYDTYIWRASVRVQRSPGSHQHRSLGAGNVYMVLNGQIQQLDLGGDTLGQAKRISSITNACTIGGSMVGVSKDGRHDWLSVVTAGPSGDCANRADTRTFLVASDMSETEVGPEVGGTSGLTMLSALPDAQSASTGILVLEAAGRLSVYSTDMKTRLYTVADNVITSAGSVEKPIAAPDADQKAYFRIADQLYLLDWQSGKVVLGTPLSQLDDANLTLNYTLDDAFFYFVRGGAIYRAASDRTVRQLAQIDAQLGVEDILINTDSSICVRQYTNNPQDLSSTQVNSITAFSKSSGSAHTLISNDSGSMYPLASSGDELVLVKYALVNTSYQTDVITLNVIDASTRTIGTDVALTGIRPAPTWLGSADISQTLLWTEKLTALPYINYPARSLKAYAPGQTAAVTLGTLGADDLSVQQVNLVSWRSAKPVIATSDNNGDQNRFWLVQLDQAQSLTPVLALP